LIFWNNGKQVLHGRDIVASAPLKFSFDEESNILSLKILTKTKEENDVMISWGNRSRDYFLISFEYLDPKDGVVLELLHNSAKSYPSFSGSIKGIPDGVKDLGHFSFANYSERSFLIWMLVIGLCFLAVGLPAWVLKDELVETSMSKYLGYLILAFFSGISLTVYPIIVIFFKRRKYPKSLEIKNYAE
jgi:hypothetical protein